MKIIRARLSRSYVPSEFHKLLRLLSDASEFDELPVRHNEDIQNRELERHLPIPVSLRKSSPFDPEEIMDKYDNPHVKTFLLFQAHLSRVSLLEYNDYETDKISVLDQSVRIIQAMIDVAVYQGYFRTTVGFINLLQCMKQALWKSDSNLMMLPYLKTEDIKKLKINGDKITNIMELISIDNLQLRKMFETHTRLNINQISDILKIIKNLPVIQLDADIEGMKHKEGRWFLKPNQEYKVAISLAFIYGKHHTLHAPYYHKTQSAGWLLLLGDPSIDNLFALRRISGEGNLMSKSTLSFRSPSNLGQYEFEIVACSDSYCDLHYKCPLKIAVF